MEQELYHHGIKGQKWGVRNGPPYPLSDTEVKADRNVRIKSGTTIHRIVPKNWVENEKNYTGHAYASFLKEDVEQYKKFARLFGDGNNYIDMSFKVTKDLVSPSRKERVDNFIDLMKNDPQAYKDMIKATRNPICFMPKSRLNKLDDPKQAEKAYEKFSYLLVSRRNLRDPYFKKLESLGYSMIIDDADVGGKLSKCPIIVFDRSKSLSYDSDDVVGR